MKLLAFIVLLLVGSVSTGCAATIMHGGGDQSVGIASSPSGAEVIVDNFQRGITPLNINLDRDKPGWVWGRRCGDSGGRMPSFTKGRFREAA